MTAPLPNRVIIGAIDHALNRVDRDLRVISDNDYLNDLRTEREALVEARSFIARKRKEPQ